MPAMIVNRYYLSRKTRITAGLLLHPAGLVMLFSICFMILLIAQLLIANKLATDGEKLTQIERDSLALVEENYLLDNKIFGLGSLTNINQRAVQLGLVKVSKVELVTPIPYAYLPQ